MQLIDACLIGASMVTLPFFAPWNSPSFWLAVPVRPAEAALINVSDWNKWIILIQNAALHKIKN